ncbi:hypothetical protein [Tabrizicola sp.]|uniref:hypothetical protein n=1 Tax=Tabrizicola sp. TaxID=2005166 RepID=UPI003F408F5D
MARIEPDPIMGHPTELMEGEKLITEFRPDAETYWRAHLIMAVILGTLAGLVLLWLQNPYPVAGPVGAVLAVAARAAFVQPEAMAEVWRLTNRRLLGPAGRAVPLTHLLTARPYLNAVQLTSTTGDKHLVKYQSDPATVSYLLMTAAGRKTRDG